VIFVPVEISSLFKHQIFMNKLFLLAITLIGFSVSSFAQATAEATVTATILEAITITNVTDMNFGNVAVIDAGTVILNPEDGSTTPTGGVTLPAAAPGTISAASFDVTGDGSSTYAITLPSSTYVITNANLQTMDVTDFTSFPSVADGGLLTAGAQTITVGATLNVDAGQAPGEYTNATGFEVTVNYN
jgi:hypothetical protein